MNENAAGPLAAKEQSEGLRLSQDGFPDYREKVRNYARSDKIVVIISNFEVINFRPFASSCYGFDFRPSALRRANLIANSQILRLSPFSFSVYVLFCARLICTQNRSSGVFGFTSHFKWNSLLNIV